MQSISISIPGACPRLLPTVVRTGYGREKRLAYTALYRGKRLVSLRCTFTLITSSSVTPFRFQNCGDVVDGLLGLLLDRIAHQRSSRRVNGSRTGDENKNRQLSILENMRLVAARRAWSESCISTFDSPITFLAFVPGYLRVKPIAPQPIPGSILAKQPLDRYPTFTPLD